MHKLYRERGGIFDEQTAYDTSSGDITHFPSVPARAWPTVADWNRHPVGAELARVPQAIKRRQVGYSNIGMGEYESASVPKTINEVAQPMDPRSLMVGRVSPFGYRNGSTPPAGFTPRGGILDGSTVATAQPAGSGYFEERQPRIVGTGVRIEALQDPMLQLRNIPTENITPAPTSIAGFGSTAGMTRPIPVSVSFARPRMYSRSVFEGPVTHDHFPTASIMPTMGPINGVGEGPDGLGAGDCGCGGWKYGG